MYPYPSMPTTRLPRSVPSLGVAVLTLTLALAAASALRADEWLVYVGGGLQTIDGGWVERRGQILFEQRGGALVSVPLHEVDLAASAILTWHLNGRRQLPPRPEVPAQDPEHAQECAQAQLVRLVNSETLEIRLPGEASADGQADLETETVHVSCLDAPDTEHRYPQLGWFGRTTLGAIQVELTPGSELCLAEQDPPLRDSEGHRIVSVTLAGGRDYTARVIKSGFGILRAGTCSRQAYYRSLEDLAIAERRGLWGPLGERPSLQAANLAVAVSGAPTVGGSPSRRSGGG